MLVLSLLLACTPADTHTAPHTGDTGIEPPGTPALYGRFGGMAWEADEGFWRPKGSTWELRGWYDDYRQALLVVLQGHLEEPGRFAVVEVRFSETHGTGGFVFYYEGDGMGASVLVDALESDRFATGTLDGEVALELVDGEGDPLSLTSLTFATWPRE